MSHTFELFFEALWDQHSVEEGEVQVERMVWDPNSALLMAPHIHGGKCPLLPQCLLPVTTITPFHIGQNLGVWYRPTDGTESNVD